MVKTAVQPTGVERTFGDDEIIVSKTNPSGRITYANNVFLRVAGYTEKELLGAPHSIIRHPDMPRCVFKLLWDTIKAKREIFAYVVNLAKNGDHYWVFAHVTPSFDANDTIIGYHSNRRKPTQAAVDKIQDLYAALRQQERKFDDRKKGMMAGYELLVGLLKEKNVDYDKFVLTL